LTWAQREKLLELAGSCWDRDWDVEQDKVDVFIACVEGELAAAEQKGIEKGLEVLREHWLFAIKCHHEAKTDQSVCACGLKSPERENVGKAVQDWIEHIRIVARRAAEERKEK